jgi:hypothetical protein
MHFKTVLRLRQTQITHQLKHNETHNAEANKQTNKQYGRSERNGSDIAIMKCIFYSWKAPLDSTTFLKPLTN